MSFQAQEGRRQVQRQSKTLVPAGRRRMLLRFITVGLASATLSVPARAQPSPGRPLALVVPFAAGGGIDAAARQISERLTAELGQAVIVENVAGAFGTIGTHKVARATPDGHTLLFTVSSPLNVAPLVNPSAVRYDTFKDFVPIAVVGMLAFAVIARNDLPAESMAALLRLARAQPGKLNFGTDGTGSLLHITGELIKQRGGVDLTHVPYKAAPQVLTDVAGGQLDLGILPLALVQPLVREGRVRALAVSSAARAPGLPHVPTLSETPGFEGVALESWMGLLAPSATPQAVVQRLRRAMLAMASDKSLTAHLQERGVRPRFVAGEAFGELLSSERRLMVEIVSRMGIKPE